MKLTGDLKKKVDAAGSRDEAKRTIADAGMELTDDELSQVAGGIHYERKPDFTDFCVGDTVRVVEGDYAGSVGTVMFFNDMDLLHPYREYTVLLSDGKIKKITADCLSAVD